MGERDITPMLVFAIFSSVLGMFQFGFNTGVTNAPQKVLEDFIAHIYQNRTGQYMSEELRDILWAIIVSVFAIGGMIGGLMAPLVSNWCGRKTGLVLNNTIAVLGVTLMSSSQLTQSIESLALGRFFIGLNCGLNTALVPMYLSEIAPVNARGVLATISQLAVTTGLLVSQILGLKELLGTKEHWPFLFGVAFVPAILQLLMLPFCPESPRYLLLSCGRVAEARYALRRLRNTTNIEDDIEEMMAEEQAQQEEIDKYGKLTSIRDLFTTPWLRAPLMIGVVMQLSQQLSGINAIFNYSTKIFLSADINETYASNATLGVGTIMVIMTIVSIPLMDKLGRRTLHLYGLAGMFLASIFLTISLLVKFLYDWMKYISVISILVYTLFFAIGPGSIPWIITAELFTQGTRPAAMSVSVLVNWFTNFVVGLTFPLMMRVLQNYLFLPFTVFLAIFWIITYKKLPETKNRTFEEIAALFRPIQLNSPNSPDQFNYGAGNPDAIKGIHDLHLQAPPSGGSQATPNNLDSSAGTITGGFRPTDRFRFDSSVVRPTIQQQHNEHNCSQLTNNHEQHSSYQHQEPNFRRSQGNIHSNTIPIPHNSCTSIAQNFLISDQQPLIADMQPDRCQYHDQIFQQPSPLTSGMMKAVASSTNCYVKTTSFMDHHNNNHHHQSQQQQPSLTSSANNQASSDCAGCRQAARASISDANTSSRLTRYSLSNFYGYPVDLKSLGHEVGRSFQSGHSAVLCGAGDPDSKSKTMTRAYRPLNETLMGAPSYSSYNLTDLGRNLSNHQPPD